MIAAWNSHDVDRIASYYTEDCIHEDVAMGSKFYGQAELKVGITPLFAACPDFKMELKALFSVAGWSALEWVMSGTQVGDFENLGIPATGKGFSIRGASIIEFKDDRISRNTDYWNLISMLKQLGREANFP